MTTKTKYQKINEEKKKKLNKEIENKKDLREAIEEIKKYCKRKKQLYDVLNSKTKIKIINALFQMYLKSGKKDNEFVSIGSLQKITKTPYKSTYLHIKDLEEIHMITFKKYTPKSVQAISIKLSLMDILDQRRTATVTMEWEGREEYEK